MDFFGIKARKKNDELDRQKDEQMNNFSQAGDGIVNNLNDFNKDSQGFTLDTLGKEYTTKLGQVESGFNNKSANALTQATMSGGGVSSTSMNAQSKIESDKQSQLFNTDLSLQQKAITQANAGLQQQQQNALGNSSFLNSKQYEDERGTFGKLFEMGASIGAKFIPGI